MENREDSLEDITEQDSFDETAPETDIQNEGEESSEPLTLAAEVAELEETSAKAKNAEVDDETVEEDENDEEEDDPEDEDKGSIQYLLMKRVIHRSVRQAHILKKILSAQILVHVSDIHSRFLYDWGASEELQVKELSQTDAPKDVECEIRMSEQVLRSIASGNLNPQIALLSDKIYLKGKAEIATFFFNLIVARR